MTTDQTTTNRKTPKFEKKENRTAEGEVGGCAVVVAPAEIGYLHHVLPRQQNILRLDVACVEMRMNMFQIFQDQTQNNNINLKFSNSVYGA